MKQITLTATFDVPEDSGDVVDLARCLVEYVTLGPTGPGVLYEDYGPGAWGGYDGAYISAATADAVVDGQKVGERRESWGKREDDDE